MVLLIFLCWIYPINFNTADYNIMTRIEIAHIIGFFISLLLFILGFKYLKKNDAVQGAFIIEVAIVIFAIIVKHLFNF